MTFNPTLCEPGVAAGHRVEAGENFGEWGSGPDG
jgi:hypothetical protein